GVGRRPRGLAAARAPKNGSRRTNANALGKYFASAAHLEAASVHAFRILRRELAECGAPDDLLAAAKRAEADEVRHTKLTATIARTHGAKPAPVRVRKRGARSLEAIALENAVEGCVRETFGALVAMYQAEHAVDHDIAAALQEIAVDETRHAALAWSVAAWANTQLDAEARKRIEAAKNQAIRDLENELTVEAHPDLVARAGVPTARAQKQLLRALQAELRAGV
ncbi:MAG: ferritin-like domain-containing protein, partial [Polyangiaceae bacterium]